MCGTVYFSTLQHQLRTRYHAAYPMFHPHKYLQRRLSVQHQHDNLVIHIARHNDSAKYTFGLVIITATFVFFCNIFFAPLFHGKSLRDLVYALPFLLFIFIWYFIGLRITVWRAFGVEEVIVKGEVLNWKRTAWKWIRSRTIPLIDVREIRAVTPWHALSNRVEVLTDADKLVIGDMLLRDEATELAHHLKHFIGRRP